MSLNVEKIRYLIVFVQYFILAKILFNYFKKIVDFLKFV